MEVKQRMAGVALALVSSLVLACDKPAPKAKEVAAAKTPANPRVAISAARFQVAAAADDTAMWVELSQFTLGEFKKEKDAERAAWCGLVFPKMLDPAPCIDCGKSLARKGSNRKKQALPKITECLEERKTLTVGGWKKLSPAGRKAWCRDIPEESKMGPLEVMNCMRCLSDFTRGVDAKTRKFGNAQTATGAVSLCRVM